MSLFEIHTEDNGEEADFGIHGVYADNKKDAIKYKEKKTYINLKQKVRNKMRIEKNRYIY